MSKYIGPACRLCRREGEKLFLKGARCLSPKCAFEKRAFAPGQHGKDAQFKRSRSSDYLMQLREKQKARRIYGVHEAQFHRYYETALRTRGMTGLVLLQLLERRLDNVVFRLGYASSRAQARNLVTHGHFNVNGRRVNIPSFVAKPGDMVELREKSRASLRFQELISAMDRKGLPSWLELDKQNFKGKVASAPMREDIAMPINENLIVELYSK